MREIILTQGKVALVDDEDFKFLNQFKWYAQKCGNTFYAVRNIQADGKQKTHRMHWEIMGTKNIDHIKNDGLNNQKANLRLCTQSENNMNKRKSKNTTSTYKGVSFQKQNSKWKAEITIKGKRIYLGLFASEIDAAKAYDAKAIEIFGDFAYLNF